MATITWPSGKEFCPSSITWGLEGNVREATSEETGDSQTSELPGSKWVVTASWPGREASRTGAIEALFAEIRGRVNRVSLFHWGRQRPRNFATGVVTTSGQILQGAKTMTLISAGGGTFAPGDMIGILGQLFMVMNSTGSGTLQVTVSPRVRIAIPTGNDVTYIRPRANFLLMSDSVPIGTGPAGRGQPFSASFKETFANT